LQETMRQDFTDQELRSIVNGDLFHWHWRSSVGRSGGMLMGIRDENFEVGAINQGTFSRVQFSSTESQSSSLK
jgi:hypothetical protein